MSHHGADSWRLIESWTKRRAELLATDAVLLCILFPLSKQYHCSTFRHLKFVEKVSKIRHCTYLRQDGLLLKRQLDLAFQECD